MKKALQARVIVPVTRRCSRLHSPVRLLILADLHGDVRSAEIPPFEALKPDLILLPGDTTDGQEEALERGRIAAYLNALCRIAPVYASLGNHEVGLHGKGRFLPVQSETPEALTPNGKMCRQFLANCGVTVLHNEVRPVSIRDNTLCLGGLTSAGRLCPGIPAPCCGVDFSLLLCHHPEYFDDYIAPTAWELTLSGHAHGGQWRIGRQGIYAPGQGLFPRYTAGFYADGRLYVTPGMGTHNAIPRFFNPPEAICLLLEPQNPSEPDSL